MPGAEDADEPRRPKWRLEFYEDEDGDQPVRRWMREELTKEQRRALGRAMLDYLQELGPAVVGTNWGKPLGKGLFEFRLDQTYEQLAGRQGSAKAGGQNKERILLRVFCHAHGERLVLLLGGYDKGRRPSRRYQQEQIQLAVKRLKEWRFRTSRRISAEE